MRDEFFLEVELEDGREVQVNALLWSDGEWSYDGHNADWIDIDKEPEFTFVTFDDDGNEVLLTEAGFTQADREFIIELACSTYWDLLET